MIKIYTSPSCSSCRKVKQWFDEQQIPYEEHNIFSASLSEAELKEILYKSENGTDDIISTRSKVIKEKNIDVNDLTMSELVQFIKDNPSVLKRPIMVDTNRIQVGYNSEEIMAFIPRERRAQMEAELMMGVRQQNEDTEICLDDDCPTK
ncbi:MAG TPA: transcriptional regulator Spx [Bacilli bacterium]|jgi:regulatory protein spx|nr:transcriptional regulator Spx [Bacilli bacterium]HOM32857.1 transcriptional regulator Spx [Bacilli bacterium]HOQ70915.1 transcriptional regulator Spx [Bacilli bacterium]HPK29308.1 transcriptional regulator Spx [Bacilli bacterium]HPY79228.1 transcriptional regulator Spx [Bacilli bacterium]